MFLRHACMPFHHNRVVGKVGLEPTALEILSFLRMPFRHNPVNGSLCENRTRSGKNGGGSETRTRLLALKEPRTTHILYRHIDKMNLSVAITAHKLTLFYFHQNLFFGKILHVSTNSK